MTQEKTALPELIPVRSGQALLQTPEIAPLVYNIQNLVSCSDKTYQKLYSKALCNIAEFYQAMPYSEKDFNSEYGFLTRQLNLALAALKLRRGILLPQNEGAESIAAEESQWTYAIFAGSLVKNLYQLQENREVHQYQLQGDLIGRWFPIMGRLYNNSSFYYSMRFTDSTSTMTREILMAALSQFIFPSQALHWLSSNKGLFKLWWDVVLHQPSEDNAIETLIQMAGHKIGIEL
jgi:hypothetical protein